ncbi:aminotransferase class IV [uncultured Mitsuokella sp.]|uniref:aminotransferase class IV n=1 Tax=uncultured Mitsuokella sp. TaxID=453120 RepID=UPI0026DC665D|nr:aminotransferase class IV [uncultured Mitsuokella sp.]
MDYGFFDGAFVPLDEAAAAVDDRGYAMGDGAFEVTRVYDGRCFALPEHIKSLRHSLRELAIPITYMDEELTAIHEDLIKRSGVKNGLIRLQVTRGLGSSSLAFPKMVVPLLSAAIHDFDGAEAEADGAGSERDGAPKGLAAIFAEDMRWLRCDINSLNRLGNVLAQEEAQRRHADTAILCRQDTNLITESTDANFFIVKDGLIWTHPEGHLIRSGVTRAQLLGQIFPQLQLTVVEKAFAPAFALTAEEAFVASTARGIAPVTKIDGKAIGTGEPGPVTQSLAAAYRDFIQKQLR